MIKDIKNCRQVHLGHGTICIGTNITKEHYLFIEKQYNPVGQKYNNLATKDAHTLENKSVLLLFDGKEGLKSLDMIIEDLQEIRKTLTEDK